MSSVTRGTWRWGVVGPGGIALRFADAMRLVEGGRITAVASRSIERADAFGDRFGVRARYGDYAALADDPDVDVVYVATPHGRHEVDARLFLEAGKPVLCEKPLALNTRQARRMVDAARSRGLFLMEALWSRFLPAYRALADVLAGGRIGEPLLVEADFGFRMPVMPGHRLFDPALGGGALLDVGIYPVQLCSLVFGGPPGRVVAAGVVGETGVDEQVAAVLHHAGGRRGGPGGPGDRGEGGGDEDGLGVVKAAIRVATGCTARISGSEGWVDLPAFMHRPDHITVHGSAGVETIDGRFHGDGLRFQIDEVHRCLSGGLTESPTVPLDETLQIATTLDRIRAEVGVTYPDD
jgi:predicted dehydrogenase